MARNSLLAYLALDGSSWEEGKHPRDEGGKFAKTAASSAAVKAAATHADAAAAAGFTQTGGFNKGVKTYEGNGYDLDLHDDGSWKLTEQDSGDVKKGPGILGLKSELSDIAEAYEEPPAKPLPVTLQDAGYELQGTPTEGGVFNYKSGKDEVAYNPSTNKWHAWSIAPDGTANGVMEGTGMQELTEYLGYKMAAEATPSKSAATPATAPTVLSSMKKVGKKPGGTNPGGTYLDKEGNEWIVKGNIAQAKTGDAVSDDRARNEVLSAELMKVAGIEAPDMKLVDLQGEYGAKAEGPGSLGVATKFMNLGAWKGTPEQVKAMQEQFAVHAWLANYDVMGIGNDNIMVNSKGQPINIDPGGALLFRAQGLPKMDFGDDASEWDSMRDAEKNPWAAAVFGGMDHTSLFNAAKKLSKISNEQIGALVHKLGPGKSASDKQALAATLIKRKNAILQKVSAAAPQVPSNQLTATEKDYIVNSHVGKVINSAGFKKTKDDASGNLTYVHPSGAKVVVHPPASGKKSSTKFTHYNKDDPFGASGEGVGAIQKLLNQTVKAAEAKPVPVQQHSQKKDDDTVLASHGFKPAVETFGKTTYKTPSGDDLMFYHNDKSFVLKHQDGTETVGQGVPEIHAAMNKYDKEMKKGKSSVVPSAEVPKVGATPMSEELKPYVKGEAVNLPAYLSNKGYGAPEKKGDVAIFKKGDATVEVDAKTGKWLSKSPGNQAKEGEGAGSLSVLLSGKKPAKPYPWTSTSTETLYVDPDAAKKAAAAKKEEAAKKAKANAAAAEAHAKKAAEFGEYMKKVDEANASASATQKALQEAAPKPNSKQEGAIGSYTGSGYQSWNDKLRHTPGFVDAKTEAMDAYLHSAVFPKDVTIFRKVSGDYSKILKSIITEGTKFVDHGYVSTTTHSGTWGGDMQFVITVKAGQRGASVKNWSSHSGENEVVLPRSSGFVVKKFDRESGVAYVELDQSHIESKWSNA